MGFEVISAELFRWFCIAFLWSGDGTAGVGGTGEGMSGARSISCGGGLAGLGSVAW